MRQTEEKSNFPWAGLWAMGFMFTLGFGWLEETMSLELWYEQVIMFSAIWFLWPYLLGLKLWERLG